jgi:hypothetical protein
LNAPARFGISAAVAGNITPNNALSVRFGSGSTLLGGYARTLVCFAGCGFWGEGASLYLDAQAGMTYRLAADQKELTRIVMYGAGVRTYLGGGFSASYGLHVNKIAHVPMYPSVYVSIGWGTN